MTGRVGRRAHGRVHGPHDRTVPGGKSVWLPTGSPSLFCFDAFELRRLDLELPFPFLRTFANVSGQNFLDVGEWLDHLAALLPTIQWRLRCGRLGMHWKEAGRIVRATRLMELRLRHERKPPARVLWAVGEIRSVRDDWPPMLLDWIVDKWARRAFGPSHMIAAIESALELAASPRLQYQRTYIEVIGADRRMHRLCFEPEIVDAE